MNSTVSPIDRASDNVSLEKSLGSKIRRFRKSKSMSIHELAEQASISVSMLSRMENGLTQASISTLQSICRALNVPIAILFSELSGSNESSFVKAGQGLKVMRRDNPIGHEYQLLGHSFSSDISMEPYLIRLENAEEEFPKIFHDGVEFIYMVKGKMIYQQGENIFDMSEGDSLYFDATVPHGPIELVKLPVVLITVIAALKK